MASTPPGCAQSPPTTLLSLPDELLGEIFLLLPAAADLARASMARVSFRRIITHHRFLRRFRPGHPPPLLGVIPPHHQPDRPPRLAQPPHPSASAASTFAGFHAADFSCSFLPSPKRWRRRDLRAGRVLLSGVPDGSRFDCRALVRELAVCDPLHRRYVLLPAIPDDLAASAQPPDLAHFEPFLDHGRRLSEATIISLPLGKRSVLMGVAGGYLLIEGMPESTFSFPLDAKEDSDFYSLNLKTLQLEWFFASEYGGLNAHLFAGFPPTLSPPTI
ncbi:unnamed protein product [Alopecurus aequalis]